MADRSGQIGCSITNGRQSKDLGVPRVFMPDIAYR